MQILDDLNWRYAVKQFDKSKKVDPKKFDAILESCRLSASSFGLQPWKFVLVENEELREKLLPHSWNQRQVVDADHLMVLCRPITFGDDDINEFLQSTATTRNSPIESLEGYGKMMKGFMAGMNKDQQNHWMNGQVYIALGNLLTACATLKVDTCPMEGFSKDEYDKILGLTDKGLTSVVVCPIGHRSTEDKYATLAKVRYPLERVVHKI